MKVKDLGELEAFDVSLLNQGSAKYLANVNNPLARINLGCILLLWHLLCFALLLLF